MRKPESHIIIKQVQLLVGTLLASALFTLALVSWNTYETEKVSFLTSHYHTASSQNVRAIRNAILTIKYHLKGQSDNLHEIKRSLHIVKKNADQLFSIQAQYRQTEFDPLISELNNQLKPVSDLLNDTELDPQDKLQPDKINTILLILEQIDRLLTLASKEVQRQEAENSRARVIILLALILITVLLVVIIIRKTFISINDILNRQTQSESRLKEEKELIHTTLLSIGDAVITTDKNGLTTNLNPVAEQLTGWSNTEAQGKTVQKIFPIFNVNTREPIENPVEKVIQTGKTVYLSNHTTLTSKDGTEYQIADSAAPICNDEGEILGMVLVFNDVTEQYRLRQKIISSEQRLNTLATVAPVGIFYTDAKGECLYVNEKWSEITGITPEDSLGNSWIKGIHPDDIDMVFSEWDQAAQQGAPFKLEYRFMNNGDTRWVLGQTSAEYNDDGEINGYVGSITDLTERKSADEALRRTQKMDALGKLTGGIAHDYNNMLGIILGYCELLENDLKEQPKLVGYVQKIYHAGVRGTKLTRKLLAFSRQKTSDPKQLDINVSLQEMQQMLEKTLTARIGLTLVLQGDIWQVWLDDGDLEDAVVNMSINAMHAIVGNGQLTIQTENVTLNEADERLHHLPAGDYVVLSITDTGCGMDEATKHKIFEPFYTTKNDLGTGLGLSQVYGFVDRSTGGIRVYSEPGHGTRFVLYFPRYREVIANDTLTENDYAEKPGGSETILVVDDEADLLELTCEVLAEKGYNLRSAISASHALDIMAHETVNLLLCDIIMPDMDGYELAAIVRQKYPDIKIQLASGFSDERNAGLVVEELHQDILSKPYHSAILLKKIRSLLDG